MATWDLDRLFYSPQELAIARHRPYIKRAQDRVIARVRAAYGARRRLVTSLLLSEDEELESPSVYAAKLLRAQQLTAELNAATGGLFAKLLEETDALAQGGAQKKARDVARKKSKFAARRAQRRKHD